MPANLYNSFSSEYLMYDYKCRIATLPPNYTLHSHKTPELFFLVKGNVTYETPDQSYSLQKNSLVISHPSELHKIRINDITEYERYIILFDDQKIGTFFYNNLPNNINVINFNGNPLVIDLFHKLNYYNSHLEGEALTTVLSHITEEILCNALLISQNISQTDTCSINPLIKQAMEYIENHITAPITIDELCQTLYVTKSHLHRLFITHLNISPKQYILSQKLLLSKRDIALGKKPTDIYTNYGFTNYSTFYRAYKKAFGYSPSEECYMDQ